jgi:hypothetical protein
MKTILGAIALVTLGLIGGIAVERVSARHDSAGAKRQELERRNSRLMAIELQTHGRHEVFEREWRERLARIDEAVQVSDTRAAVAAWREAYSAAMRRGQWRDLVEVGEAALRIGDVPDLGETPQTAARRSYVTALYRAQAQRSVDGILRVAQGFASLDDRAVAENCVTLAYRVADSDADAQARVRAFAAQLASRR